MIPVGNQTLYATGMSPGATVGPSSITLKNTSTVNGATLDIVFSYTESDGSPNVVNVTADEVAAMIQVTTSITEFQPSRQCQR